jgi:hypothetical protein
LFLPEQILVHSAAATESATAVALHTLSAFAKRAAVNRLLIDRGLLVLTARISLAPWLRSGRQGCFREALHEQAGKACADCATSEMRSNDGRPRITGTPE